MSKRRTQLHRDVLVTVAISVATSAAMSLLIPASAHLLSDSAPNPLSGSQAQLKVSTDGGDGGSNDNGGGGNAATNTDGSGNGSNDCTLVQLQCAPSDTNCATPPTFKKLACGDPTCQKNFALKLCTDTSCTSRVFCVPSSLAKVSTDTSGGGSNDSGNGGSGNSGDNSGGSNGGGSTGSNTNSNGGGGNGTSNDGGGSGTNNGNNGSGNSGNGGLIGGQLPGNGSNDGGTALGCFTTDGNWTTDRSACDPNQARHFRNENSGSGSQNQGATGNTGNTGNSSSGTSGKTSIEQDQQDQQLQVQLDSQFHSQNERDSAYANLVNAATTALEHTNALSQQTLPVEAATAVSATQQWIQQLLSDLSTGEPTVEQVQQQAQDLRDKLQETQSVLASSIQVTPPKPETLTDPLSSLLSAIPNVFQFLQQQGVVLTQDPLTEYQTAASLYVQYKPQCLQNSDACLQMSDVISHLENMRNDLEQILQQAGRTDLEPQIDQMLQ